MFATSRPAGRVIFSSRDLPGDAMTAPESAVNTSSAAPAGRVEPVAHARLANAIRALAMDAVEAAKSGHPGMPMGMADVATVLFTRFLKFDPADARWPDRDRFVLSAGHGSIRRGWAVLGTAWQGYFR